jgi:Activator of Hsp90 ATPase homolog 1-like protein
MCLPDANHAGGRAKDNEMKQQDYHKTITADIPADEAFAKIGCVSDWWTKGFSGQARKPGDTFSVRFGETYVDFEITEVVPNKKIVWQVTDCNLHRLKGKKAWNDTKVEWEVSSQSKTTKVSMTHVGLVPGIEGYEFFKEGWNFYVGESLLKILNENKGLPDGRKSAHRIE